MPPKSTSWIVNIYILKYVQTYIKMNTQLDCTDNINVKEDKY